MSSSCLQRLDQLAGAKPAVATAKDGRAKLLEGQSGPHPGINVTMIINLCSTHDLIMCCLTLHLCATCPPVIYCASHG
jgi:hypothetical protein